MKTIPRRSLMASAALLAPLSAPAQTVWLLITPDEVSRERATGPHEQQRGVPIGNGPKIEVDQPDLSKPVRNPISFRVRFIPRPNTPLNLTTFKVTYGWLRLDITSRLLQHATLTPAGLAADNADIPPGEYQVTLSIEDALGQVGSREIQFTVAA